MFTLTEEQRKQLNTWTTAMITAKTSKAATGGRFTYSFTPTGIGTVIVVKDSCTGEKIDLSDYDSW